jgi:branched-chain amino acid transport system substrate-binding protein
VEGAAVAIQMKKLGMDLRIFGMASLSNPNFIKLGGKAVEGTIATTNFARDMSAEAEAWTSKYEKVFAKSTVMLDPVGAWLTYSAVKFPFVRAVKMAGSMDKKKVRDALEQVKWREYGQDIDNYFDKEHALVKEVIVLQVKNGKFVYVKKIKP